VQWGIKGGIGCRMRADERKKLLWKEQQGELGQMEVHMGLMAWWRTPS
jgi:hypothetical protein